MLPERAIPRYAHAEGHTDMCFSDDGKYMVTCGSEGDIRIWSGFNDDDPVDKCVGEKAFAVAQKVISKTHFFVLPSRLYLIFCCTRATKCMLVVIITTYKYLLFLKLNLMEY